METGKVVCQITTICFVNYRDIFRFQIVINLHCCALYIHIFFIIIDSYRLKKALNKDKYKHLLAYNVNYEMIYIVCFSSCLAVFLFLTFLMMMMINNNNIDNK